MGQAPITTMGFECERCGHEWVPRDLDHDPRVCPKCKSPYWNTPRVREVAVRKKKGEVR